MSAFDEQVEARIKGGVITTLDDVFEFIRNVYDFVIPEGKEPGEHAFNVMDYYAMEELAATVKQQKGDNNQLRADLDTAITLLQWLLRLHPASDQGVLREAIEKFLKEHE